jgi:hypothetical protein
MGSHIFDEDDDDIEDVEESVGNDYDTGDSMS